MSASALYEVAGQSFRVQYTGCDYIKTSSVPTRRTLQTLALTSPIAFIKATSDNQEHVFYVNQRTKQFIDLALTEPDLQRFSEITQQVPGAINDVCALELDAIQQLERLTRLNLADAKQVKDIAIKATPNKKESLLRQLHDEHATPKNACFTYLFQNALGKYEVQHKLLIDRPNYKPVEGLDDWMTCMRGLSSQFIDFEHRIQRPSAMSPMDTLHELHLNIKTNYLPNVLALLDGYKKQTSNKQIHKLIDAQKQKLKHHAKRFCDILDTLSLNHPTHATISALLSIHTRDEYITSLGNFMANQMMTMLDCGIEVAYELSDNRALDLFHMPEAISAMSDAKAMIQLKAFSLDGAEYNDTYAPIPDNMLDTLQPSTTTQGAKWFSLTPYLSHLNPIDLDRLICIATGENTGWHVSPRRYVQLGQYGKATLEALTQFSFGLMTFVASLVELVLIVPTRFVATLALASLDLLISIISPAFASRWTQWLDHKLSSVHAYLSPVRAAKRLANQRYQRTDELGDPIQDEHQALIEACMNEETFYQTLFIYFNPARITQYVKDFVGSWVEAMKNLYRNPMYLFSSPAYKASPEEVYNLIKLRAALIKQFEARIKKETLAKTEDDRYEPVTYCHVNEIATPFEVFRDIMLTLDDTVVDPMFRKSPGAATFYFMISMTTFGTYLAPQSMLAWMKSVPAWLQMPTEALSIHFTGKSATHGMMEQMVACFLEWKIGFFTTELLMELQRGNFDFLHEVVKEPEQVTLGFIGLVGMGMALRYLPLLPTRIEIPHAPGFPKFPPIYNYYAEVLNVFIEEAKSCADGTIGFTSIEYGFLGIKFAMLMHSMLSGAQTHEKHTALKQLAERCTDSGFIEEVMHECADKKLFDESSEDIRNAVFLKILDVAIASRVSASDKLLPEDKKAFKSILKQVVSFDAIAEYKRLNNPEYRAAQQNKQVEGESPEHKFHTLLNLTDQSKPEPALHQAKAALEEAIALTQDKNNPLVFDKDPFKEANKYYDHLDGLFETYNQEAKRSNRPDLCIDKRPYLDVFYNKYCYRGSNNLLRSLMFFPVPIPFPPYYFPGVYLAVALYRGLKYAAAKWQNKPSVAHQVVKSFNKDFVLLMQVFAIMARTGQVMMRSLGYLLRPFVMAGLLALTSPFYLAHRLIGAVGLIAEDNILSRKDWFKSIDGWASSLTRLHRFKLWDMAPFHRIRVAYAKASRTAGGSQDIHAASDEMLDLLDRDKQEAKPEQVESSDEPVATTRTASEATQPASGNRYGFLNQCDDAPDEDEGVKSVNTKKL